MVGAGRGERLRAGVAPGSEAAEAEAGKAFVALAGRPLLAHALEALAACPAVDLVVPVVAADALERARTLCAGLAGAEKIAAPVAGGAERQDSVARGLEALPGDVAWVAVHSLSLLGSACAAPAPRTDTAAAETLSVRIVIDDTVEANSAGQIAILTAALPGNAPPARTHAPSSRRAR